MRVKRSAPLNMYQLSGAMSRLRSQSMACAGGCRKVVGWPMV
jgi:hypothetical protein